MLLPAEQRQDTVSYSSLTVPFNLVAQIKEMGVLIGYDDENDAGDVMVYQNAVVDSENRDWLLVQDGVVATLENGETASPDVFG